MELIVHMLRVARGAARIRPRHCWWNLRLLLHKLAGTRLVLFECQQPRDWEHLHSIYQALERQSAVSCVVLVNDRGPSVGPQYTVSACRETLLAAGVRRAQIAANISPLLFFGDAFVAATAWDNLFPVRRSITRVHVPHGLVNKVDQFGQVMRGFDVLFSSGPTCTKLASASLAEDTARYEIVKVGYPKLDLLLTETAKTAPKYSDPKSGASAIQVLFAPSWGRNAALDRWGLRPVEVLSNSGFHVIVKLHPMSLAGKNEDPSGGGTDWHAELARLSRDPRVDVAAPGLGSLVAADVMVSDVSGIAYEFLLLDKPVVFLDVPEFFADLGAPLADRRPGDLSAWGREFGRVVSVPEELPAAVRLVAREANGERGRLQELASRVIYNRGRAGETAAAWLSADLDKRPPQ